MFTVFLFYKEKELFTGEGCVGMVIPWQLCRTIGPLTLYSQEMQPCPSGCVCVCVSAELFDLQTQKLVQGCSLTIRMSSVSSIIKVIGLSSSALALAKKNLWLSIGPMVRHNSHGSSICLFSIKKRANNKRGMCGDEWPTAIMSDHRSTDVS